MKSYSLTIKLFLILLNLNKVGVIGMCSVVVKYVDIT